MAKIAAAGNVVAVALVASLMCVALIGRPAQAYDGTFVSQACNTQKTTVGSDLYNAIQAVIADLAQETPYNGYDYKDSKASGSATAYGRGTCTSTLAVSDCTACINYAGGQVQTNCDYPVGARYKVVDCYVEFEDYSF
jgi:hypothetical protein